MWQAATFYSSSFIILSKLAFSSPLQTQLAPTSLSHWAPSWAPLRVCLPGQTHSPTVHQPQLSSLNSTSLPVILTSPESSVLCTDSHLWKVLHVFPCPAASCLWGVLFQMFPVTIHPGNPVCGCPVGRKHCVITDLEYFACGQFRCIESKCAGPGQELRVYTSKVPPTLIVHLSKLPDAALHLVG